METVEAISEGQWSSFNGLCSEEADFVAQLLGNCSIPNEIPSSFVLPASESNDKIVDVNGNIMFSSRENAITHSFSRGNTNYDEDAAIFFPSSSHGSFYSCASQQLFVSNNSFMTMDYSMMETKNNGSRVCFTNNVMEADDFLDREASNDNLKSNEKVPDDVLEGNTLQLGMMHEYPVPEPLGEDKFSVPSEICKKRSRLPGEDQRNRSMKLKKCLKLDNDDYENYIDNSNTPILRQGTSSWCLEDESIASLENTSGMTSTSIPKGNRVLNSNGKTRASRGSVLRVSMLGKEEKE